MNDATTWVGLDAHKKFIQIAMRLPGEQDLIEWRIPNTEKHIQKLARKLLKKAPGPIECAYEAGPCGFPLQRQLEAADERISCKVIAPALIPRKPGERVKTDRRDARKLRELLEAGLLTEVVPPTEEEESVRDLCRCREAAKTDLHRARHRLAKLLLRRGYRYTAGRPWTQRHRAWLRSLRFDDPVDRVVFDDYLLAIDQLEARIANLESHMYEVAQQAPYREPVAALCCFRGIALVTALTIVAELHDIRRFEHPRKLMSFLGLTPSEFSSGGVAKRGSITKAGNSRVRRLLIESSWHYRHRPSVGAKLSKRREGQPARVIAIADRAQQRLHRRFWKLTLGSNKPANKAVVAVARELAGFVWAALHELDMDEAA